MDWKQKLNQLEQAKKWDEAIEFMKKVIDQDPNNMDAYIFMNYLLINLLIEEEYDKTKQELYINLSKWYFDESYRKFSDNPEYLYLTGRTAVMGEWLYGIDVKDYEEMIEKAKRLEPNNPVYNENYYWQLSHRDPKNPALIAYAQMVLSENSPIKEQLKSKGAVGEYLIMLKENWAKGILRNASK